MLLIDVSTRRLRARVLLAAIALAFSGCALKPNRAPVEDRSATPRATVVAASPAEAHVAIPGEPARPVVADSNAGRPGYYTIKPGDTLIRIGLDNGQNWKDLMKWNDLVNPNLIEVGQVIRIVAPGVDPAAAMARPVAAARVETKPLEPRPG
ncbi:MAG: LysM domain-containing protein, partial [Caldimonas sp.]